MLPGVLKSCFPVCGSQKRSMFSQPVLTSKSPA